MSDDTLPIDMDILTRLAKLIEPHHHALLQSIRAEFGDDKAATLHTCGLFMMAGAVLKAIPNADRAPDGIAMVWSLMRVPFSLEPKQVQ
jgi:hypothetical protein